MWPHGPQSILTPKSLAILWKKQFLAWFVMDFMVRKRFKRIINAISQKFEVKIKQRVPLRKPQSSQIYDEDQNKGFHLSEK